MTKKLIAVIVSVCLCLGTLSLSGCTPVLTIVVPSEGYSVTPGGSITLETHTTIDSGDLKFEATEGNDYIESLSATGELKVKDGGKSYVGKTIKVRASIGDLLSDEVTITIVDIVLTAITNLSIPHDYLFPGESTTIDYSLQPANSTQDQIEFELVSDTKASFDGNTFIVGADADEGIAKVRAKYDNIVSEIFEIEIKIPTSVDYFISSSDQHILVENRGTDAQPSYTVRVNDRTGNPIEDATVDFSVTKGNDIISISSEDYSAYITILGHGEAEITATLLNGKRVKVEVTSIKTPSRLDLPEYLNGKSNIQYTVGMGQEFDFAAIVPTDGDDKNACQDIEYSIQSLEDDASGEAATISDGKITFTQTGKVKVTATSVSGNSNGEVSTSMVFMINEGINVSSWSQLKAALTAYESAAQQAGLTLADSTKEVNIIVTQKPKWADGSLYGDRYDIVPEVVLNDVTDYLSSIIIKVTSGIGINGNLHALDLSGLKYNKAYSTNTFASVIRYKSVAGKPGFDVNIQDLIMYGNVEIDGLNTAGTTEAPIEFPQEDDSGDIHGVHGYGLEIGTFGEESYYDVNLTNVKLYNFNNGIRIARALPGSKCTDLYVGDCFKNGLEVLGSIIELENFSAGPCGATAIEAYAGHSSAAGLEKNLNQKITFTGDFSVEALNANAGNTKYLSGFKISGYTVHNIITAAIITFTEGQVSHILKNNEFKFVSFIFHSPFEFTENTTDFQLDGVVNLEDIGTTIEKNAKYIKVPVKMHVAELGGTVDFGWIIAYNWNYEPAPVA